MLYCSILIQFIRLNADLFHSKNPFGGNKSLTLSTSKKQTKKKTRICQHTYSPIRCLTLTGLSEFFTCLFICIIVFDNVDYALFSIHCFCLSWTCPHFSMQSCRVSVQPVHSPRPNTTNSNRITRSGSGTKKGIDFSVGTTQQDKDKTKICLSQFARCSPNWILDTNLPALAKGIMVLN